ncbi:MAG: PIG-L family deacetylase [Proteobacteria bacterium]|nr:PIG-L family deacetylase [Pseudomonadota bacterium]
MARLWATLAACAVAYAFCGTAGAAGDDPTSSDALPPLDAGTSLLVVAPHPDDEILCCAGIMQRVLAAGGRVNVVWITSGDGSELSLLFAQHSILPTRTASRTLGARRMAEARRATALLGVAPQAQWFLGYPDGALLSVLQQQDRRMPATSYFTDAAAVPYPDALAPGHAYLRANLIADFAAVLERAQPTLVLAPSTRDTHPDHRAAGLLTAAAAADGQRWQLRYWIVHGGEGWPSPRGLHPGLPLTTAPRLAGDTPADLVLSPQEEDRKLLALRCHVTQMQFLAPFLLSFVRTTELFYR